MERKIGEVFEYDGKKYEVVDGVCDGRCCFQKFDCLYLCEKGKIPECLGFKRNDEKEVVFIEVEEDKKIKEIKDSLIEQECCWNCVYSQRSGIEDCYEYCNVLNQYVITVSRCKEYKK